MNASLIMMVIVFALGAGYFGIESVGWIDNIKRKPLTFVTAFAIACMLGVGISYFTINGLPEKGFGEFFGNYSAPLIILGIVSFPGFIYFVVGFNEGWKFICASLLLGMSIGACLYDKDYLVLIATVVAMLAGFFGERFLTKVKNNL